MERTTIPTPGIQIPIVLNRLDESFIAHFLNEKPEITLDAWSHFE